MEIIVILIIASLLVALGFLGAFIWAVKSGQYDDKYTPAVRMLFENKKDIESKSGGKHQTQADALSDNSKES